MLKLGDEPIPGYRLQQFLGQGLFGKVWSATGPGNTLVALKFIELTGLHGWKEFRAVQRVKQIRHAHLMPIVALWLLDNEGNVVSDRVVDDLASRESTVATSSSDTLVVNPHEQLGNPSLMIIANLLANHSLGDRLKEVRKKGLQGIPHEELLGYVTEAAKGLDFLNLTQHTIGVSEGSIQHCDVKPDNILLIGGSVVLADWGVAQLLAGQQTSVTATSLGGTPAYMPPECFNNTPCSSSDQYSLAVTYYHLRTGQLPFFEETYAAVFEAHRDGTLDFSKVSDKEQRVLRRATANDPDERFTSCSDFVTALKDSPVASVATPHTGRGILWTAIVVGIALILGLTGYGLKSLMNEEVDPQQPEEQLRIQLPYSAAYYAKLADRLLAKDDFDGAVEVLAKAIAMDPATYARIPEPLLGFMAATDGSIVTLEISRDERTLLVGTKGGVLRRFSFDAKSLSQNSLGGVQRPRKPGPSSGFETYSQWPSDGDVVHEFTSRIKKIVAHQKWMAASCSQGDKIWLASSNNLSTGLELTLPKNSGRIVDFAITGDGHWLVAAVEDYLLSDGNDLIEHAMSSVIAWDLQANIVEDTRREVFSWDKEIEVTLAVGQEAPWFVLASYATEIDSCIVRQCWVDSKQERPLYKERGEKRQIAVGRNDRLVAIGGERSDSSAGEHGITLVDINTPDEMAELPWGHASLAQLAWDSAGGHLVSSDHNGDIHVWQIPKDYHVGEHFLPAPIFLHATRGDGGRLQHLARDGFRCFTLGWLLCHYSSGEMALWDCSEQRPQAMPLALGLRQISAIAVSAKGNWIAVGGVSKNGEVGVIGVWPGNKLRLIKRASEKAERPSHRCPTVLQIKVSPRVHIAILSGEKLEPRFFLDGIPSQDLVDKFCFMTIRPNGQDLY